MLGFPTDSVPTCPIAQIRICYGGSPFRPDGCGGDCVGDMVGGSSGTTSKIANLQLIRKSKLCIAMQMFCDIAV